MKRAIKSWRFFKPGRIRSARCSSIRRLWILAIRSRIASGLSKNRKQIIITKLLFSKSFCYLLAKNRFRNEKESKRSKAILQRGMSKLAASFTPITKHTKKKKHLKGRVFKWSIEAKSYFCGKIKQVLTADCCHSIFCVNLTMFINAYSKFGISFSCKKEGKFFYQTFVSKKRKLLLFW